MMRNNQHGQAALQFNNVSFRYPTAETSAAKAKGRRNHPLRSFRPFPAIKTAVAGSQTTKSQPLPTHADQLLFDSLQFRVEAGEFICIIGPSGSGKSTLFKLITGLSRPETGQILLHGTAHDSLLGKVGYMPQHDLLLPWRTVVANAALPLELKGASRKEAEQRVTKLLGQFGLEHVANSFPWELSGGMRQRVSFLRAVLSGSDILLLDEPFSALDAITRLEMQEWLMEQWKRRRTTVLFITHDVDEALFLADRIFVLHDTPVRQLHDISVPLRRPRNAASLHNPELIALKQQLLELLRTKVKR
ncbi:putative hydroxymethylpyrimidine transport system ATP-binding protein [Evansella caseinilytica]|uniref:Putative hydroxymethylpyrimidine transport system ATP-binding protein n=1 Tax=Evansella caseinilytica TaxID=1503961 RepID=A0A1H3RFY8_9BACI|nr:putative hydroxymethylpyrimidine transport system ATP-binding protein [Evansella caseinilytica]